MDNSKEIKDAVKITNSVALISLMDAHIETVVIIVRIATANQINHPPTTTSSGTLESEVAIAVVATPATNVKIRVASKAKIDVI